MKVHATDPVSLRAALETVEASDLRGHVEVLADDSLQGRDSGSPGGHAASKYLALLFEKHGLEPAGERGTFLQVFGDDFRNIIGIWPGSDPELADELIIIGAHYDHVGLGNPNNSYGPYGVVHNGADDNASGTSTVLELVEALCSNQLPLRRPVMFCLWDAEEDGLLGSKYWLENPTVPLEQVCFSINLDMVGRLWSDVGLTLYGERTAAGLRELVCDLNEERLPFDFDWDLLDDSDHHPFIERRIPTLMFHTGLHDQYHRPSDDVETLNFEGMQSVARLVGRVLFEVSELDQRLEFRDAAWQENEEYRTAFEMPAPSSPSRLGIALQDSSDSSDIGEPGADSSAVGLVIEVVEPGSPAETAGLVAGSRILAINGQGADADSFWDHIYEASELVVLLVESPSGDISKPTVTLAGSPARVGMSWRLDEGDESIAVVTRVAPMSRADRTGLQVGDRIYRVNDELVTSNEALREQLLAAHGELPLRVERAGVLRRCTLRYHDRRSLP
ncbi:MAG: M20/M25/M40 family metallo-hydrolase [Pirellulaceae bacterium]